MPHKGFTLIELLVVISIIGVLSSIVLASLNVARTKGQIAAIRSNLYNMIAAQELEYDNVSPSAYPTASTVVLGMVSAISNAGGTAAYYSFDGRRWGASAKLNADSTKKWAVDQSGVVTWDTQGVNSSGAFVTPDVTMNWATAISACATAGGRLPTLEQLKAFSLASGSVTPPGFQSGLYLSITEHPTASSFIYIVDMTNGGVFGNGKSNVFYVHCVR